MQINISVSAIVLLLASCLLVCLLLVAAISSTLLNSGCTYRHGKGRGSKQSEEGVYTTDEVEESVAFRFIVVYDPFGWWNVRSALCALISTNTIAAGAFVIIHAYALVNVVNFSLAIGFGSAWLDLARASSLSDCFLVMMYKREQQLLNLFSSSFPFLSPR